MTIRVPRTTFTQNAPSWQIVFNHQEGFDIFGNGNDDKLSAKLISRKDDTTSLWTLKMLCSFKSPPPTMRSHHKQRLVPLLMRWSKTLAHICTIRATWTWLCRLFLGAQGCCNLQLPQFWLNILIHPTPPPPFPPSLCFYYVKFGTKMYCMYCIVCIWLCSVLDKSSCSKNL